MSSPIKEIVWSRFCAGGGNGEERCRRKQRAENAQMFFECVSHSRKFSICKKKFVDLGI